MRVRANGVYVFNARGYDVVWPEHYSAENGQRVRVVKLPGCPPPNTMGHAHIVDDATGGFLGLVCTVSLTREGM
jgi:hypothetical protein